MKMIGSSIIGSSALTTTVAADQNERGTSDAGITEKYLRLVDELKFDKAHDLLRENNVDFTSKSYTYDSNEVSKDDFFGKGSSSATFDTVPTGVDDEYFLKLEWNLRNVQLDIDTPKPIDLGAIGYKPDIFAYVDDSLNHSGKLKIIKDFVINNVTSVDKEPPLDTTSGASVKFDDRYTADEIEGEGYMQIRVRRTEDSTGTVGGAYSHAWSPSGIGSDHSVSVSFGVISFSTGSLVDSWELPGQDERDQDL